MIDGLYPLKFFPLLKPKIWGGNKIQTELGIDISPLSNCGEAWVLSGVEGNESVVANGFLADNNLNELIEIYMDDLLGSAVYDHYGEEFPVLIKFIDANDKLSIQVHPDDNLAKKRDIGSGKTEMWYILQADKDAEIINGFNKKVSQQVYLQHLKNKTLPEILNVEKAQAGDVFFIPAGRIHALGAGLLLAEIQQKSDNTYRIYDWDRVDENGNPRTLHIQDALDAIDYSETHHSKTQYKPIEGKTVPVVNTPYFTTNYIHLKDILQKDFSEFDTFIVYVCTEGRCIIDALDKKVPLLKGETILLPAITNTVRIIPEHGCKLLEVYILM